MTDRPFPELESLKPSEVYVESARFLKDDKYFTISIGRVITKKGSTDMEKALKSQLKADDVFLFTLEK